MTDPRLGQWVFSALCLLLLLKAEGLLVANVSITILESAVARGAVCLDGSPPAYHFDRGSGSGINSWLVHIQGGAWCHNVTDCLARKEIGLGSSIQMEKQIPFSGILSNNRNFNPDFYNWNRVNVRYCDGSSFTGDVEAVDPVTNLHFRGARIWLAVIEELLAKGMKNAENAILSGCSAGGLTSILHCDGFRALLPMGAKVKCLSDAGYFINTRDISGALHIQSYFNEVVLTHGSLKNLPQSCTSRVSPSLCFFPQYAAQRIRTPLFILNAAYDNWQITNITVPDEVDPHGDWVSCKRDISNCSLAQLEVIQGFRKQFLYALSRVPRSPSTGMFIDSCYVHCQSESQELWFQDDSPVLSKKSIAKAVADWFYERASSQKIDCPYPCNPSCPGMVSAP